MLRQYSSRIYDIYQSRGLNTATRTFGRTFGSYLIHETFLQNLQYFQNDPILAFFLRQRFPDKPNLTEEFRRDLGELIEGIQTEFLQRVA